jgi:hypothetical protein
VVYRYATAYGLPFLNTYPRLVVYVRTVDCEPFEDWPRSRKEQGGAVSYERGTPAELFASRPFGEEPALQDKDPPLSAAETLYNNHFLAMKISERCRLRG